MVDGTSQTAKSSQSANRVIAYVDGFNLYFGLKAKGWRRYYWLDLPKLAENLLRAEQQLLALKYFTARIAGPAGGDPRHRAGRIEASRRRQTVWLEAIGSCELATIFEGHYLGKDVEYHNCGSVWRTHEEKMTDVQIATQILVDAFADRFDTALIISADSDLVPPIQAVREYFSEKRIVVAFPPARQSYQLRQVAHASFPIGEAKLRKSLLPINIVKSDGHTITRPPEWH